MEGWRRTKAAFAKMRGMLCTIPLFGEPTYRRCSEPPTLEELQAIVGGYIEVVPGFLTYNGELCIAYCDEEGSLKNKARNERASALWREQTKRTGSLRGDVAILYGDDEFMEAL